MGTLCNEHLTNCNLGVVMFTSLSLEYCNLHICTQPVPQLLGNYTLLSLDQKILEKKSAEL